MATVNPVSDAYEALLATSITQTRGSEDAYQNYLGDIRRFGLLSETEEIELARQVAAGDERARRKLIESNLRLVIANERVAS